MANMLNMSTHTYIKKEKKLDAFKVYEAMKVANILESDINYIFK